MDLGRMVGVEVEGGEGGGGGREILQGNGVEEGLSPMWTFVRPRKVHGRR